MAFLRKTTCDKDVSIGIAYSAFQKTIRRGLTKNALYYGGLIYKYGTPNALRKRIIQSCLEDMCNLDLAIEVMKSSDEKLLDYIKIISQNKKTHISAWFQRVALDYAIYNTKTTNEEILTGIKMHNFEKNKNYKNLKEFLGKELYKLYTFMNRERLVWAVKILNASRNELNYTINYELEDIKEEKFNILPNYILDKHTPNGTPGYKFFFDHSLKMNNKLYLKEEPYEIECKNIYLSEELNFGFSSRTKHTMERYKNNYYYNYIMENSIPISLLENNFRNIIQVQLLCRKNYPKVYFCTNFSNGSKYVLKGVLSENTATRIEITETIKKIIDFPHLNTKIIKLNSELWMISDSLTDYTNSTIKKESKIESERNIYNGKNSNCSFDNYFLNIQNGYQITLATILKIVVGATDFASRNYICKNDIIYSIDDHCDLNNEIKINLPPKNKIKKVIYDNWCLYINFNKENLIKKIKKWRKKIKTSKLLEINIKTKILNRLNKIIHFLCDHIQDNL